MISFSIRVVVVRGETQRKPKVTTTLPEKVVSGPYYLTVPKCTDPCLSKQSAASPFIRFIHTFNSTAKTVNVFYVFATSHQWATQPQTVLFSAETLLFDKHCWSFQRQHQFQADIEWSSNGRSWGPPMPCTIFLMQNDREVPCQRAVLPKEYPMRTVSGITPAVRKDESCASPSWDGTGGLSEVQSHTEDIFIRAT